jgi:signal transduction histidine kinase
MTEVSCRALEVHLRYIDREGIPLARFIEGLDLDEAVLRNPSARIRWDDFARLCDRLAKLCGSIQILEQLGAESQESPALSPILKIAALFASVRSLYWAAYKFSGVQLFRNIQTELEVLGPCSLRLSATIPEPYLVSPAFFYITAGTFRVGPRILLQPDSVVVTNISGRRCDYLITHAPSTTIFARVRHAFLALFSAHRVFEELRAQNDELRKRMQEVSEARHLAEEASRLKSHFLANITHEVRTPLNGVIGMTDLLLDRSLGDVEREYASTIRTSAQNLLAMLNDVLDFSKIEAGKLEITYANTDIRALVNDVERLISPPARQRGLELTCELAADLPALARVDAVRVRQVLLNLASNAVKFTPKGKIAIRVALAPNSAAPAIRFEVRDTGIGIAKAAQAKIFQPFVQQDGSLTRRYGGTGLGLTICKQLVDLMHGTIEFESETGIGSTFQFTIPIERGIEDVDVEPTPEVTALPVVLAAPLPIVQAQAVSPRGANRVLVAEDNVVNRMVLVRALERLGCAVDIASEWTRSGRGDRAIQL